MFRPSLALLAAVMSILPSTALASGPEARPSPVDAERRSPVIVRMRSNRYVPSTIRVRIGQTVVWKNVSLATHTVTNDPSAARFPEDASLPDDARPFDSGPLGAGARFEHTFGTPGVYRYFCLLHEAERMVGTVIVEP